MAEVPGGSISALRLARSVAHRLKYYIDVKRKEDSFDSSGVIRDETENSSLYIKDNKWLEHDFAEIKLEASLRAYVGSTEECNRKVQESAARQKDLEKLIKKMAQDYVPDRTNEGRRKHAKRQKRSPIITARLHARATPFMSPEEVRRLVSSASKLIVAATSEASPKEPGSPREGVLSPERKDTDNIQHLGDSSTQCPPFTCSHKDEAKATQEYSEECIVEAVKKKLEKNGRKKSNGTKKEKNSRDIRRPTDISSDIFSNIHKSEGGFSRHFQTPSDKHSPNAGFATPYLQTGQNKRCRKVRAFSTCTPSVISEHHNKETNVQQKKTSPSQQNVETGHSYKPFERKRQKSSDESFGVVASIRSGRSDRLLKTQPIVVQGHNRKVQSPKWKAEAMRCNSTVVSESSLLKGQGNNTSRQLDQRSKFVKTSRSNWQKREQGSKRNLEGQRVHFQQLPHESIPGTAEWKHHGLDGWSTGHLRGSSSDQTQPSAAKGKCPELLKYLQEDQKKEPVPTAMNGSSFLYQGMDQEAPNSLTVNGSVKTDGHFENERASSLFNQLFLLNEPGGSQATNDPAGSMQELCNRQMASSPLNYCASKALGVQGSGSPLITGAVLERLGDELTEEEFTISSASRSLSAGSFASLQEQMNGNANIDFKEEEQSTNFSTETLIQKILNMTQEESATPQEIFCQRREKLRLRSSSECTLKQPAWEAKSQKQPPDTKQEQAISTNWSPAVEDWRPGTAST